MGRSTGLSVNEDGGINPHVVRRQKSLIKNMRELNYVLDAALEKSGVPRASFLRWYQEDETFRELFDELEDEQMPLLRQTLRELGSGTHPTSEGRPDKTILRYIVAEYDKRKGNGDDEFDTDLTRGLERMNRDELAKIAK